MKAKKVKLTWTLAAAGALVCVNASSSYATSSPYGDTSIVSVDSIGVTSDRAVDRAILSSSGRYAIFLTNATNLVTSPPSGYHLYKHDRTGGATGLVSTDGSGNAANGNIISLLGVSGGGRYVLFSTNSSNLDAAATGTYYQLFVKDTQSGSVYLASSSTAGTPANTSVTQGMLSDDGQHVVFSTTANNLDSADTNTRTDVYEKDISTGTLSLISADTSGNVGNGYSVSPAVSEDGRYVAFSSTSTNLAGSGTGYYSVYRVDTQSNSIANIIHTYNSSSLAGPSPIQSTNPFISGDGTKIMFRSNATNLVSGDTNAYEDTFIWKSSDDSIVRSSLTASGSQLNVGAEFTLTPQGFSKDGNVVLYVANGHNNQIIEGMTDYSVNLPFTRNETTGAYSLVASAPNGSLGLDSANRLCNNDVSNLSNNLSTDGLAVALTSSCALDSTASNTNAQAFVREIPSTLGTRITGAASTSANAYGWFNANIPLTWSLTDPTSTYGSIAGGTSLTVSSEGASQRIESGQSCDGSSHCVKGYYYASLDKTVPSITGPLSITGIGAGNTVSISLPVSDTVSGVLKGEYYIDSDPGVGSGVSMGYTGTNVVATIPEQSTGVHTVNVRVVDKAGNWTSVVSTYIAVYPHS